jgi:hypothetical protein
MSASVSVGVGAGAVGQSSEAVMLDRACAAAAELPTFELLGFPITRRAEWLFVCADATPADVNTTAAASIAAVLRVILFSI